MILPVPKEITCYVINLDRSPERWDAVSRAFYGAGVHLVRVPAVDVSQMAQRPGLPEFDENRFRRRMGREAMNGEIGCYLSHIMTLRMFLATDDEHAMICEDDIRPADGLAEVVREACRYSHTWEFVRLYKKRHTGTVPYARLAGGYSLCTAVPDFIHTAAYLVNRRGAGKLLEKLVPMCVPYDAAIHRGWVGIREASLLPSAVHLSEDSQVSTINVKKNAAPFFRQLMKMGYKVHARCVRYTLQTVRILWRKCRPPRPMDRETGGLPE